MAVKKSVLYSKLWDSCDTLRSKGGMDATQYKDYVLIILFMKVITDKYYGKKNSLIEVPPDANFNTMILLKGKKNIGSEFNRILEKIAQVNDLQGIIDVVNFADENKLGKGKDMVDILTGLVEIFQDKELDFSNNRADDDDILGDAYEYLMKKFATEAGKSKGQFYTPSEVSRIMAKILKVGELGQNIITVYDMTCGSGSLLLKAGDEAKPNKKVYLYGQEKDTNTASLCVMNMFLHGNETATIRVDNTLTKPRFLDEGKLKTFDFCVANPPFSVKKWNTELEESYGRFEDYGMPPDGYADYAFLLHMLKSMNPFHGRAAIILPHGVLFRGGQEELIRKKLVLSGNIEGIIGLPANLFYGTGISACIIVLDRKDAPNRKSIFIVDASKEFIKEGNKNKLREQDIKKIIDTYNERIEKPNYSRIVSIEDIIQEGFNLNIPRYISANREGRKPDFKAHLLGGIPKAHIDCFEGFWKVAPKLRMELFSSNSIDEYYQLNVKKDSIDEKIEHSKEIQHYFQQIDEKIKKWEHGIEQELIHLNPSIRVKEVMEDVANQLLDIFQNDILIDQYNAYEYLMNYYAETWKDDLYMVTASGWIPTLTFARTRTGNIKRNEFDSELLPKSIVIRKFFREENEKIVVKRQELDSLIAEFDCVVEDNSGEELLFEENQKITETILKSLRKEAENDDISIIDLLLENLAKQKQLKKEIKSCEEQLNEKILQKYQSLTEEEFRNIIIYDKWFRAIQDKFDGCKRDLVHYLATEMIKLDEEYEYTLADINSQILEKERELSSLLKELTSNRENQKALHEFIEQLGGDCDE